MVRLFKFPVSKRISYIELFVICNHFLDQYDIGNDKPSRLGQMSLKLITYYFMAVIVRKADYNVLFNGIRIIMLKFGNEILLNTNYGVYTTIKRSRSILTSMTYA